MEWDDTTNVCGKAQHKASTVKGALAVAPKLENVRKADLSKSKSANATKKSEKKQTHAKRRTEP